jgi:hypothetical protein
VAGKAGVSFMCVYVSKGSEKAKQKENAMMRRNGEEEATRYIFFSVFSQRPTGLFSSSLKQHPSLLL